MKTRESDWNSMRYFVKMYKKEIGTVSAILSKYTKLT